MSGGDLESVKGEIAEAGVALRVGMALEEEPPRFGVVVPGAASGQRFATDIESYVEWTLDEVAKNGRLKLLGDRSGDHGTPWPDWPGTRYEAKGVKAGRRPAYLAFEKR